MCHPCLLLACSWFAPVSLQYIDTGAVSADSPLDLVDNAFHSPPYAHYFNLPPNFDNFPRDSPLAGDYQQPVQARKRRTTNEDPKSWLPNLVDTDKTVYYKNDEIPTPIVIGYHEDENKTDVEKRNFSPWGGKRDGPHASFEHMWSWKRAPGIREPSMPKRVRFSPWGGKRSGQMIYKPGVNKASKLIFFSSVPELRRIVSNYAPSPSGRQLNLASFHFIPGMDKRHPIKILALSSNADGEERTMREALPFNNLMENLPQQFKLGHPYNEVHLKKDGKRKMKFSIWGGKRSPPIIGPIWTPASEQLQDSTLHTILLLRNKIMKNDQNSL